MHEIFDIILNFIYPPKCIFCGEITEVLFADNQAITCDKCLKTLPKLGWVSKRDKLGPLEIWVDGVFAFVKYVENIKHAVRKLKFNGAKKNAVKFAELMFQDLKESLYLFDVIVPVPVSKKRELERGYNQCMVMAKRLGELTDMPVIGDVLIKTHDVKRQSKVSGRSRNENAAQAFDVINKNKVSGKNILILDDILTTGSTLAQCADLIKKANANRVYCAVFAMATKN